MPSDNLASLVNTDRKMSEIQIHELSSLMRHSHLILHKMRQLTTEQQLTVEDVAWFRQNKEFLSSVLSRLQSLGPCIEEKIRKRQAKRRRQKHIRIRKKREKETAAVREREMDEWICEKRKEEARKEKKSQNTRVLMEQISSIEKHHSLLALLEKLARARGSSIEPTTPGLEAKLSQLRKKISETNDEQEGEKRTRWFLFNEDTSPTLPSPEALLKIRNDWDHFVSSESTASSIPIGWVTPSSACKHCEVVYKQD